MHLFTKRKGIHNLVSKVRFNEINVRQNINNIHNSHVLCQSANHNPRKIVMVEIEIIVAQLPSSKFYQRIYRRRRLYIFSGSISRGRGIKEYFRYDVSYCSYTISLPQW